MSLPKPFATWTTYDGHSGIDFPAAEGTPIPALGEGVVTFVGWNKHKASGDRHSPGKAAGNARCIRYGAVEVRICHLESLTGPSVGDRVSLGDDTGPVGQTGLADGPHVHVEVWVDGVCQKGANFWRYISRTATAPAPALAGGDSKEFMMPISDDDASKIAFATLARETPGLEKSTGGPIPDETVARRLRVIRAHTNGLPARLNKLEALLVAQTAAIKALASTKAIDPTRIEAAIDKSVKEALDGWSLTITPGEPD